MTQFYFISLFPSIFGHWLSQSIVGRARKQNIFDFHTVNLRDFGCGAHKQVDDSTYGGGSGMVLSVEPLVRAVEETTQGWNSESYKVIYFSPSGERFSYRLLERFHSYDIKKYILVCGHYEGIDQRFIDHWVDFEISVGDFVSTGGELPALLFVDSFVRGLQGTLCSQQHYREESFQLKSQDGAGRLLEYPQYTRPLNFRGHRVPEVLVSGHHGNIAQWRKEQAELKTRSRRPDLTDP